MDGRLMREVLLLRFEGFVLGAPKTDLTGQAVLLLTFEDFLKVQRDQSLQLGFVPWDHDIAGGASDPGIAGQHVKSFEDARIHLHG